MRFGMDLSGAQRAQLQQTLVNTFPKENDLAQMVSFGLNERLQAIASGTTLSEIVFNLIEWADAHGKLEQLIAAATQANPGNKKLRALAAQLGRPPPAPRPP